MSGGAIVFTLARLGPPALSSAEHTRFLPRDLLPDREALAADSSSTPDAGGFAGRVLGDAASGGLGGGSSGVLKLPQAFGAVYLGQVCAGDSVLQHAACPGHCMHVVSGHGIQAAACCGPHATLLPCRHSLARSPLRG